MQYGTDPNGSNVIHPIGFKFSKILITNHSGKSYDIKNICTDIEINESLYGLSTNCTITVVDGANFLEFHGISGNEKVSIHFHRNVPDSGKGSSGKKTQEFEATYFVAAIPEYSRPKTDVQVYKLQCVSELVFLGQSRRIARTVRADWQR